MKQQDQKAGAVESDLAEAQAFILSAKHGHQVPMSDVLLQAIDRAGHAITAARRLANKERC